MIIDLILDRKDSDAYNPKEFYNEVMEYSSIFEGAFDYITKAMDYGNELDVKNALCTYIDSNDYNPEIKQYIKSKNWLQEE